MTLSLRLLAGTVAACLALLPGARPVQAQARLAVLLGRELPPLRAALAGIEAMPEVRSEAFYLDRGTTEVDRVVSLLRSRRFDAVVALGARAHEFFRSHGFTKPYAATLVLGQEGDPEELVPFDASPEEWAQTLARVFPRVRRVGALATGEREEFRLRALATALAGSGKQLEVRRITERTPLTVALRELLQGNSLLYFPRDRGLLRPRVAMEVLKAAHRFRVPVVAFSRSLVRAGAVLALDVPPARAGERAARIALGLGEGGLGAEVTVNRDRARSLGLSLPPELAQALPGQGPVAVDASRGLRH